MNKEEFELIKEFTKDFKNKNLTQLKYLLDEINEIVKRQQGIFCLADIKEKVNMQEKQIIRYIEELQKYNVFDPVDRQEAKEILKDIKKIRKVRLGRRSYFRFNLDNKIYLMVKAVQNSEFKQALE